MGGDAHKFRNQADFYKKQLDQLKTHTLKYTKLSEEDYNSLMESLYLAGIPGMYESIVEGANTKLEDCEKIEWK